MYIRTDKYQYHALVSDDNRVTGLCYNDKGILSSEQMRIGVTQEKVQLQFATQQPFHTTHTPPISPIPQWFQCSATMTEVNRIRLYTDNKKPQKPTVGMLLIYETREELLGQFGYDHDIEDYELTGPVYYFSGNTQTGPCTKVVCNREMGEGWIKLPQNAELVWWFRFDCSVLEIIEE
ncbi:uncharacterized protein SETTUDRAFT_35693 [Exserohilum turcica Et28A]|uniref:Uncharacterized protein n=1 Tax=Exserohilum turcicum (strain 28A) TaxID=671987 RepID=R0JTB1_EXST2|nr:uncharacterized protein SETTUDRAFT_35693 [Exserohilum turcica Et28A]EOA80774.1 hypothetical protein SETTUDRAFT_35693 [Exserohilum turcica Et28A]